MPSAYSKILQNKKINIVDDLCTVFPKFYVANPKILFYKFFINYQEFFFDSSIIERIIAEYNFKLIKIIGKPLGGHRSKCIIIKTNKGRKLIKKYKRSLGEKTIIQEHSILKYLDSIKFPATRLVTTKSGKTLIKCDKDQFALYDFVENGFRIYDYIFSNKIKNYYLTVAGKLLSYYHNAIKDFTPEGFNPDGFKTKIDDRWRDFGWFQKKMEYCVERSSNFKIGSHNNKLLWIFKKTDYIMNLLVKIEKLLKERNLERLIIHGDYGASNILFRKKAPPVLLDFEIARLDWRIVDIVVGWESFCCDNFDYDYKKMNIFLQSYQKKLPLNEDELRSTIDVWEIFNLKRTIIYLNRYCKTLISAYLINAHSSFERMEWIISNENNLMKKLFFQ